MCIRDSPQVNLVLITFDRARLPPRSANNKIGDLWNFRQALPHFEETVKATYGFEMQMQQRFRLCFSSPSHADCHQLLPSEPVAVRPTDGSFERRFQFHLYGELGLAVRTLLLYRQQLRR